MSGGKYTLPNRVPLLGRYSIQIMHAGYAVKRIPLAGSDISAGQQTLEDVVLEGEPPK